MSSGYLAEVCRQFDIAGDDALTALQDEDVLDTPSCAISKHYHMEERQYLRPPTQALGDGYHWENRERKKSPTVVRLGHRHDQSRFLTDDRKAPLHRFACLKPRCWYPLQSRRRDCLLTFQKKARIAPEGSNRHSLLYFSPHLIYSSA